MAIHRYGGNGGNGAYLEVDISELQGVIGDMKQLLSKSNFMRLMQRTFREVGNRSKVLISREAAAHYAITQKWVKQYIGSYRLQVGGSALSCTIPLKGHKGTIGGTYKANGLRSQKISTSIVKKKRSRLPDKMKNQGGNAPFINTGLGGVVFTRRTSRRLPIVRVVGLGAPQFPMNQAEADTREAIFDYLANRLQHNFEYMFMRRK